MGKQFFEFLQRPGPGKSENCQRSRDVLSRLTLKSRIRVRDEDGEYRVMPEEERQDRIAQAQEGIALYCASA